MNSTVYSTPSSILGSSVHIPATTSSSSQTCYVNNGPLGPSISYTQNGMTKTAYGHTSVLGTSFNINR